MRGSRWSLAMLPAVFLVLSPDSPAGQCLPKLSNGNVCTAKDLRVQPVVLEGPAACTEGETISVRLRFTITGVKSGNSVVGANERYGIGLFVGDDGEPVLEGQSCTLASLVPLEPPLNLSGGSGGYRNLNGDACGDIRAADITVRNVQLDDILCRDANGNGRLDFSHAVTWETNASLPCTDPADPLEFVPRQSSQCVVENNQDIRIIVEPPPAIEVVKNAVPDILGAPGGTVTYTVLIANLSSDTDPVTIDTLDDDLYGNLDGQGSCSLPQVIPPGGTYACQFEADVIGNAGDTVIDVITAAGTDNEGEPVEASDSAEVSLVDIPPPPFAALDVVKLAIPESLPEPGGDVLYRVLVQNTGTAPLLIEELLDDLYGDLHGQGDCAVPQAIPVLGQFECAFVQPVAGQPGDTVTDIVSARHGSGENAVIGLDDASVNLLDVPSAIEVRKIAVPDTLPEPGGQVDYLVELRNASLVDAVTITSLVDNLLGDLHGQGDCLLPQVLAPAALYACSFSGMVNGQPGDVVSNTVTAEGTDDDQTPVMAEGGAHVAITDLPASMAVEKIAIPSTVTAPGDTVTFQVRVTNTSQADAISVTSLVDDVFGDLHGQGDCALPSGDLAPGEVYACSFDAFIAGNNGDEHVNVVVAEAVDDDEQQVPPADDSATVSIGAPQLSLHVAKAALPSSLPERGGDVTFQLNVTNTSTVDLTITDLADDLYGNLDGQGSCATGLAALAPGDAYACSFVQAVEGNAGLMSTDTITVTADGGVNGSVQAAASATVELTDLPSSIAVIKTAEPNAVLEPGETVTFRVEVFNTSSADTVTIDTLLDDVHGDLDGRGSCLLPWQLAPGASMACNFDGFVSGLAGDNETNTVTAAGLDDDGAFVGGADSTTVFILESEIGIEVVKQAALAQALPGAMISFEVTVTNQSPTLALDLVSLHDDQFGDLSGQGSCSLPQTLQPGASYACSFSGTVQETSPGLHQNVLTAVGRVPGSDPENPREVSDQDTASVLLLGAGGPAVPIPSLSGWMSLALASLLLWVAYWRLRGNKA